MSHTNFTEAAEHVEKLRKDFFDKFLADNNEAMTRALEAFMKTGALMRAQHQANEHFKVAHEAVEAQQSMLGSYADYMLSQYFHILNLTQDQVDTAAHASNDLMNLMQQAFDTAMATSTDMAETGSPSIILQ